jgi:hypothetical protein
VTRATLVVACALVGCWRAGGPSTAASDPRDDALAYIPTEAQVVIVGDGGRMRASRLWQRVDAFATRSLGSARTRFAERCGYDPLGVERVTVGMWHLDGYPWSMVIVARGIDPRRLEACLTSELRAVATRDGDMWRVKMPYQHPIELATVGSTVVAYIAPDANATTLATLLRGGAPLRHSAAFTRQLADLPNDAAAWSVGTELPWRGPRTFAAAITLDDGITMFGRATFSDPRDAAKLRSWATQLPPTDGKVDVAVDGTTVTVRGRVTGEQVEAMLRAPFKLF